MWCKQCGQDVPGIASQGGGLYCARCGAAAEYPEQPAAQAQAMAASADHGLDLEALEAPPGPIESLEDWDIERSFRQLQARLGLDRRVDRPKFEAGTGRRGEPHWRVDHAHRAGSGPHTPRRRRAAGVSVLVWTALTLGLMVFACGVVLSGLSMYHARPELWSIGLPLVAAGQTALLLGLVLQLERMWQNNRLVARKLDQVDSQLDNLERTTALLSITHNSASQAFYAHMADQSNPHLLLADLKGQIDLLAMSMAKRS